MNDSMTAGSTLAPLNLTVPAPSPSRLAAFWQWWTAELRSLVPARLMKWMVGDVAVTDVMVANSGISLVRHESGKTVVYATIPNAEATTHPLLRELRAKGNDQARLLLGPDQVLQRTIALPAAIEENLREVMGFELDRHTPFVASQAYYDVKLQKRDVQRDTIEVVLSVAARAVVEPLLALLRQAGLSVAGITIAGDELASSPIELLPVQDKPARKWGNLLRLNLALLGFVLFLGLLALLLPIWQKREAVIALNPMVGKASADFEISQRVHDEYVKLASEYNYINGKKQGMYSSLVILEELTKISPDTTALQSLDLKVSGKTREVTLLGEAQSASKVIESLEQSPLFQNATQRSQTRKGTLGTNEWFHVATELKPKALPAMEILPEKPPEPVVAAPAAVVVPAPNTAQPVSESPVKATSGNVPAGASGTSPASTPVSVPAKSENAAATPVPAKQTSTPPDVAPNPAPANRKQP